jgi:chromosome segregation ATPase
MATTKQFNTFEQTTLSFNPFANLGEQIQYGALANSCGFGTIRKGESSFACILASYLEQQEEIKRLRKELEELKPQQEDSDDEEEEDEGYTEEEIVAEFNKEADKYGATAEQRKCGLALLKTAFEDEDPTRKAMTMAKDAITRVVKENEELKKGVEALARQNGTLSLANYRLKVDIECLQEALDEEEKEEEELCCVICDCELDEAAGEVCRRDWEGDSDAPMCACCWDDKEAEEDADEEDDE